MLRIHDDSRVRIITLDRPAALNAFNAAHRDLIAAARRREDLAFSRLLGQPANVEALSALSERRSPDFAAIDAANPLNLERHRVD